MKALLIGIVLVSSCCIAQETKEASTNETAVVVREWTAISGAKIKAEFVAKRNGMIELKKEDGKSVSIPESALSAKDKEFLKDKPETTVAETKKGQSKTSYPSEAKEYKGHHYLLVTEKLTWKDAKKACEGKGGHLVTIGDVYEKDFIKTYCQDPNASKETGLGYWIGLAAQSWHNNKFVKTKRAGDVKEYALEATDFKWVDNKPGVEIFSKQFRNTMKAKDLRDFHVFCNGGFNYELREEPLRGYICEWDE